VSELLGGGAVASVVLSAPVELVTGEVGVDATLVDGA
jgi:hypothetical protein